MASDFGREVRRLLAERGLSLRALARQVNYDAAYLSRAISGAQRPSHSLAAAVDRALCTGGTLAALAGAPSPEAVTLGGGAWTGGDAAELRDLLTAGAAKVDESNALQLAHEWLVMDPPQVAELRAGRRVGDGLVAKVEARIVTVRRMDDFVGGGDLAAVVDSELQATAQLAADASYSEPIGRRILTALGELAQLAGWANSDAGNHATAARCYLAGVKAAHAAGDRPLAANLLSSLSYQAANNGQEREAVLLARSALHGARAEATPRTRALLSDRVAWAHTKAGQAAETDRALAEAGDAIAAAGPGDADPDWVYWVDADELDVMAGRCYTELHRPLKAEPLLREVIGRYDAARVRETSLYLTWLAQTYVDAREIDEAAATALRALDLSSRVNSQRGRARVAEVREHLRPWRGLPAVADFEERYAEA